MLAYVCLLLAADADLDTRIRLLRYWTLLASAVFAISVPHVLLPDPHVHMLQRLNRTPHRLFSYQAKQWGVVVGGFLLPGLLLTFYEPGDYGLHLATKAGHGLANLLVVLGIGAYSFERYVTIGPTSQAWQEGNKGQAWRSMMEHSSIPLGVPNGLVPALTATARVFTVGLLGMAVVAYVSRDLGPLWGWIPGGLLLGWTAFRLLRLLPSYDRSFYATNAFYSEIFRRAGGVHVTDREPIPYGAVYWVPPRWKPSVWASLRQLDRKLPLGRFIALGHLGLWILFFQDAAADIITVYLLLFIAAQNGTAFLLVTRTFAPMPFQTLIQSPRAWVITRFFANLRWTMPFLLSLLAVAIMDRTFSFTEALTWTALDVGVALLTAIIFTYATEFQHSKRFA